MDTITVEMQREDIALMSLELLYFSRISSSSTIAAQSCSFASLPFCKLKIPFDDIQYHVAVEQPNMVHIDAIDKLIYVILA